MDQSKVKQIIDSSDPDILFEKSREDISNILGYDIGNDIESGIEKVNELLEGKQ